jgi:hypothetical protein
MYLDMPVMYPVSIPPDESTSKYFTHGGDVGGGVGRGETGQRPGRRTSSRVTGVGREHGLINYVDTKAKCRHLKN